MTVKEEWFTEPEATRLQNLRQKSRAKRHITYDCLNNIVKGDRVFCKRGTPFGRGKDGSMMLITVLTGRSSGVCKKCMHFNGEDCSTSYCSVSQNYVERKEAK